MEKIRKTIKEHNLINNNEHIVLGLSGGPDSVCLFNVLMELAEEMELSIHPVHVNHKFRPGAAERDQEFVEELCKSRGLSCRSFVVDCAALAEREGITSEEAGRKVRYSAFSQVAEEVCETGVPRDRVKIAVAQNADDQVETILFRILRGTGTDGLSGISYERTDEKGFRVIRPLLDTGKAEVWEYCREKELNPCVDHTNSLPVYTRNKIRLELIPYLEREYNSNIRETIIRMGRTAASDSEYLDFQSKKAYKDMVKAEEKDRILLDGEKLSACHRAIRRRVISLALEKLGLIEDISYAHYEGVEKILKSESPSAQLHLPKGYYVARNYSDVKVCRAGNSGGQRIKVTVLKRSEAEAAGYLKDKSRAVFDYDKMREALGEGLEERISVGFRRPGDYLPIGDKRRKKIQDYFVDEKIPKDERDRVALVKTGSQVLWVPPQRNRGRFCGIYRLDDATKKVICIEFFCDL